MEGRACRHSRGILSGNPCRYHVSPVPRFHGNRSPAIASGAKPLFRCERASRPASRQGHGRRGACPRVYLSRDKPKYKYFSWDAYKKANKSAGLNGKLNNLYYALPTLPVFTGTSFAGMGQGRVACQSSLVSLSSIFWLPSPPAFSGQMSSPLPISPVTVSFRNSLSFSPTGPSPFGP